MMEPWLKIGRIVALTIFVIALVFFFTQRIPMLPFAFLALLSLCFFIGTESFGRVAASRTLGSRVIARSSFVLSLIVVIGIGYSLAIVATS